MSSASRIYESNRIRLQGKINWEIVDSELKRVVCEKAENGQWTAYFPETKGYLHSRYNPETEAMRFASAVQPDDQLIVVYGFGLGYHIEKILERSGPTTRLTVFEASLPVFCTALEMRDLYFLADPRVEIYLLHDLTFWIQSFSHAVEALERVEGKLLIHTPSLQGIPEPLKHLRRLLEEWKASTGNQKAKQQLEDNLRFHQAYVVGTPNISFFFKKFEGIPGVLISAGPSLDQNGHYLSLAKDKAVLLAVGTAVKPLLKMGVEPDLVLVTDPSPKVADQLEGIDWDVPLVLFPSVHESVAKVYRGPKIYAFQRGVEKVEAWAKELAYELVDTGGSVATAALDILIQLGCNPIVLVGQDLAYTNQRSHATNSIHSHFFQSQPVWQTEAYGGGMVGTSLSWDMYRKWMERKIIQYPQIMFLNATEGGARIHGTKEVDLHTVIQNFNASHSIRDKIAQIIKRCTR